jgi:hypothetical protein
MANVNVLHADVFLIAWTAFYLYIEQMIIL